MNRVGEAQTGGGCKVCGLIGCACHAVEEAFDGLCKKCHTEPCECEGKPLQRASAGICTVCRRNQATCICASHHPVKQVLDPAVRPSLLREGQRPYSDAYIERLVNEALNMYYYRDADGLAKWLRKALR